MITEMEHSYNAIVRGLTEKEIEAFEAWAQTQYLGRNMERVLFFAGENKADLIIGNGKISGSAWFGEMIPALKKYWGERMQNEARIGKMPV